mmetsp:Transcript_123315/g.308014  ORF Transcript_123315/g.308014 Transcript_123315/m.308014 type:complete len:308 (-) Transcript_123315:334-1257(-)
MTLANSNQSPVCACMACEAFVSSWWIFVDRPFSRPRSCMMTCCNSATLWLRLWASSSRALESCLPCFSASWSWPRCVALASCKVSSIRESLCSCEATASFTPSTCRAMFASIADAPLRGWTSERYFACRFCSICSRVASSCKSAIVDRNSAVCIRCCSCWLASSLRVSATCPRISWTWRCKRSLSAASPEIEFLACSTSRTVSCSWRWAAMPLRSSCMEACARAGAARPANLSGEREETESHAADPLKPSSAANACTLLVFETRFRRRTDKSPCLSACNAARAPPPAAPLLVAAIACEDTAGRVPTA